MAKQQQPNADTEFESLINNQIDVLIAEHEQEVDVISFVESPNYLNQKLRGVQKFVLKVFYGLPLTDNDPYIKVRQFPHDPQGTMMTECEYAQFLIKQNRVNFKDVSEIVRTQTLLLVVGRRAGKTFIVSCISAYEIYRLISKGNPQRFYGIQDGQKIKVVTVATNTDQARIASDMIKTMMTNSQWFAKYIEATTTFSIRVKTKRDLALGQEASLSIEAMACTASGIRGNTVIVAILDELAHFKDNTGNTSGDAVYHSLIPSIATFGADGRVLALSNPYNKSGVFYTLFKKGMGTVLEPPVDNIRVFKIPSWEMNDLLDFNFFIDQYKMNPESFDYEYAAEFSSTVTVFIKFPEKVTECIEPALYDRDHAVSNKILHYVAIDPASVGNGYALCMCHTEEKEVDGQKKKIVVVDRWRRWLVTDEEFEELGLNMIDPAVIDEYIIDLSKKFRILSVRYDQYESASSIAKLVKHGIRAERKAITMDYNMEIYKNLRNLFYNNEILIPDYTEGILEIQNLQEKKVGKRKFKVEAPLSGDVSTDDLADVLAVAAYMATQSEVVSSGSRIVGMSGGQTVFASGAKKKPASTYKQRLAMHGTMDRMEMIKRRLR